MIRQFLSVLCLLLMGNAGTPPARLVKSGTGFIVSPDGFAVTAAHVVTGCPAVSVWASVGIQHAARVVATDTALDIALLQIDNTLTRDAPIPPIGTPPPGGFVLTMGYGVYVNEPRRPVSTRGIYLGKELTESGIPVYIIHARFSQGDSGGPVLGSDGTLFGMVIGRDSDHLDLGLVLSASEIERFLNEQSISLRGNKHVPLALRDQILAISLLIQCLPAASTQQ